MVTAHGGPTADDGGGVKGASLAQDTLISEEAIDRLRGKSTPDQSVEASTAQPDRIAEPQTKSRGKIPGFLNLPPELRNAIYDDLLTLRERKTPQRGQPEKYCYPEILGTCRQVHEEAAGYLCPDGLEMSLAFVVCDGDNDVRFFCGHTQSKTISCFVNNVKINFDSDTPLFTSPAVAWPAILCKVSTLHLSVDLCTPAKIWLNDPALARERNKNTLQLNHAIHDLLSFLEGQDNFGKMHVSIRYHGRAPIRALYNSFISPLNQYPPTAGLTVQVMYADPLELPRPRFPQHGDDSEKDCIGHCLFLRDIVRHQIEAGEKSVADKERMRKLNRLKMEMDKAMEFRGLMTKNSLGPLRKATKKALAYLEAVAKKDPEGGVHAELKQKMVAREGAGTFLGLSDTNPLWSVEKALGDGELSAMEPA